MFVMSAREFNQSVARAQRIADEDTVFITRRGEPAYVLMSIAEYRCTRSVDTRPLSQRLAPPDGMDVEDAEFDRILDEVRRNDDFGRPLLEFD